MADWTVQAAKAQMSELMRRARAGEPQRIGTSEPCILVSEAQWLAFAAPVSIGAWLVASAPSGADLELPARTSTVMSAP